MRRIAAVLVALLLSVSARAASPEYVEALGQHLSPEERALLAAVLTDPANDAAFDADAREATKDGRSLKLVLDKWRGKMAAFAMQELPRSQVDYNGRFENWESMMTPAKLAYTRQKLSQGGPKNAELQKYLTMLDGFLKSSGGKVASPNGIAVVFNYDQKAGKVSEGIAEVYRKNLEEYVSGPLAQTASQNAAAAEAELARRRAAPALPPSAVQPASPAAPIAQRAPSKPAAPSGGALDQLKSAAGADDAGKVFDGGANSGPATGAVGGSPRATNPDAGLGKGLVVRDRSALRAAVPTPPSAEAKPPFSMMGFLMDNAPAVGAAAGAFVAVLFAIAVLSAGPWGLAAAAAAGAVAGAWGVKKLFS